MAFENFPKEYEDVFTNNRTLKKCKIDLISNDIDMDINTYISKIHNTISDYQHVVFGYLVKIIWLFRRFCYRGRRRKQQGLNGIELDGSFAVFMRRYVGFDMKIISKSYINQKVITYFDDFFPDFDVNNPFECDYEYPYKHMRFEMLILVHGMPERLDLLKNGEEKKMGYVEFMDYIINYINCYNDKYGKTYEFIFAKTTMPYIKKYEEQKIQTGNFPRRKSRLLQKQRVSTKPTPKSDASHRKSKRA